MRNTYSSSDLAFISTLILSTPYKSTGITREYLAVRYTRIKTSSLRITPRLIGGLTLSVMTVIFLSMSGVSYSIHGL